MIRLIDYSHYSCQEAPIDWAQVITDDTIKGAIGKVSQGDSFADQTFWGNWDKSRKAGLITGGYHFDDPTKDPIQQAVNFLRHLPLDEGPMIIALDVEQHDGWDTLNTKQIALHIRTWMGFVEQFVNGKPMIYSNPAFIDKYLVDFEWRDYPLWLAEYSKLPDLKYPWKIWQTTGKGQVPGVHGDVDLNVFNGKDLKELLLSKRVRV